MSLFSERFKRRVGKRRGPRLCWGSPGRHCMRRSSNIISVRIPALRRATRGKTVTKRSSRPFLCRPVDKIFPYFPFLSVRKSISSYRILTFLYEINRYKVREGSGFNAEKSTISSTFLEWRVMARLLLYSLDYECLSICPHDLGGPKVAWRFEGKVENYGGE